VQGPQTGQGKEWQSLEQNNKEYKRGKKKKLQHYMSYSLIFKSLNDLQSLLC